MARLPILRKKRVVAFLAVYLQMLNTSTIAMVMICVLVLIENLRNRKCKRRVRRAEKVVIERLVNAMERLRNLCESVRDSIAELASCIKHESERESRRAKPFEELVKVEGLNVVQRVRASRLIIGDENQIDFFFSLPTELRKEYLDLLLSNDVN